jgi:hypothetical protein
MQITVWHNGVPIHDRVFIPNKTGAGRQEGPEPLPIRLQDHGNPVVFRNLWIVDTTKPSREHAREWVDIPVQAPPAPVNYPPPFPVPPRPAIIPIEYFGGPRW